MTDEEFVQWLEAQQAQFLSFVNEDALNLIGAVGSLIGYNAKFGFLYAEGLDREYDEAIVGWAATRGKQYVYRLAAVSLWAALEAYLEDLWVETLQRVTIDGESPLMKVRASIMELQGLPDAERYRMLWHDVRLEKVHGVDRYKRLFELIGVKVSMSSLHSRGQDLRIAGGEPMTDEWIRERLHELRGVRNVILHRAGVVDERLSTATGGRRRVGETLEISDPLHVDFGGAVHGYAGAAVSAVGHRLDLAIPYLDMG